MKTAEKIIIAGIVGTSVMTLYSYLVSKKEKEQFREPELLNALIDRSHYLPSIGDNHTHPAGWGLHYGIGITFVAAYRLLWKASLHNPTFTKTLIIGAVSGAIGIASWKVFFSQHDNPPRNDRQGYYRQLFIAHLLFAAGAALTYKKLNLTMSRFPRI